MSGVWLRRVYDDPRYADTARHLIVDETEGEVTTACGRTVGRVTNAVVPNRLVPAHDGRTCGPCLAGSHAAVAAVRDVVVTVPKGMWSDWIDEGDLPGEPPSGYVSHFWIAPWSVPTMAAGDRVYIVAHGRLRGFAPLRGIERRCELDEYRACLMRDGDAQAVTIAEPIRGFQGWRYRWWDRSDERPFPEWQLP